MAKWRYYRIKLANLKSDVSVIDILSDELGINQEDIEWVGDYSDKKKVKDVV